MKKIFTLLFIFCNYFSYSQLSETEDKISFITVWKTTTPNESIIINLNKFGNYKYNYSVDWDNDGIFDQHNLTDNVSYQFNEIGEHTIRIRGKFPAMHNYLEKENALKLIDIKQWGNIEWETMHYAFYKTGLKTISAIDAPDLSKVVNLLYMFGYCSEFNGEIGHWDVSHVENMNNMFHNCYKFNGNIGNWDVSNVITMNCMFASAREFNQDISNWNTGKVENMNQMFHLAQKFNQDISKWDYSKITTINGLLEYCKVFDVRNYDRLLIRFKNQNLKSLSIKSNCYFKSEEAKQARTYLIDHNNMNIVDKGEYTNIHKPTTNTNTAFDLYINNATNFKESTFGFSDLDQDPFDKIKITSIPLKGYLWLDTNKDDLLNNDESKIILNQEIKVELLPILKFTSSKSGSDYFKFKVNDYCDYSENEGIITIETEAPLVSIKADKVNYNETDNNHIVKFKVVSNKICYKDVNFSIINSGNANSQDYSFENKIYTIPKNTKEIELELTIKGDDLVEEDEKLTLTISNIENAEIDSDKKNITLHIENDDYAPVLTSYTCNIIENSPKGTVVGQIDVQDQDLTSDKQLLFTCSEKRIEIDSEGIIRIASNLSFDYETENELLDCSLMISDGTNSSTQNIIIWLTNVNDVIPVIVKDQIFEVIENETHIGSLKIIDEDVSNVNPVSITLFPPGDELFYVNMENGEILVKEGKTLDFETSNQYTFDIVINDGDFDSEKTPITILVKNINDNKPEITSNTININENTNELIKIEYTDADHDECKISLIEENDFFSIENNSLKIKENKILDFETQPQIMVKVKANDGKFDSNEKTIILNINDVNDNKPVIKSNIKEFEITEEIVNNELITTFKAIDADSKAITNISDWKITNGNENNALFIDEDTGELKVKDKSKIDFDKTYSYQITVSDGELISEPFHFSINFIAITPVKSIKNKQVSIYPTINKGVFSIKSNTLINKIELYNIVGKLCIRKKINSQNCTLNTHLEKGIYLIKLFYHNQVLTKKIIVK